MIIADNKNKTVKGIIIFFSLVFICLILRAEIELPQNDFMKGWKRSERLLTFVKSELFSYIDGGAELFLEFGFEKLYVQKYFRDHSELTLEIYQMECPESALGIYLLKCGQETPVEGLSARNSGEKSQFTILKDRYFIHVNNFNGEENLVPAMIALSQEFLKSLPEGNPPKLFDYLSKENLINGTERIIRGPYALQPVFTFGEGDILKLGGKIFGVLANYSDPKGAVYTRIIIPYPDQEKAWLAYQNLHDHLDPYHRILRTGANDFSFVDYRKKFGTVILNKSILEISINLDSETDQ